MRSTSTVMSCAAVAFASLVACGPNAVGRPMAPEEPPRVPVQAPTPERDINALFQTDALRYTLVDDGGGPRTTIRATFTNATNAAVYFTNCNGSIVRYIERLVDGAWVYAWGPIIPACLSEPIVVAPGSTYELQFHVAATEPGDDTFPRFDASNVDGIYRIVWYDVLSTYAGPNEGSVRLPIEQRASNRFALALEQ